MNAPNIVLAHWPALELITDEDAAALNEVGNLLNREPLGNIEDPRAAELLGKADALLGHWGCPQITQELLDMAPNVKLFTYAAGTVKMTVTEAIWERDIRVTSGAIANAEPVVEFTVAAILFANKDVIWQRDLLRDASIAEQRQEPAVQHGNWDKTIGIVGASLIGRRVIEVLKAFPHLNVALYDPFVSADEAAELGATKMELNALCKASDILSIHAPALPSTMGMIGAEQLALLRTGATLINTARGPLVDHNALTTELQAGRISAMLDVTDPEPLPDDSPLRTLPNVFLTPHLAGSQGTELRRMVAFAAEEIKRWSNNEPALNEVTQEMLDRLA